MAMIGLVAWLVDGGVRARGGQVPPPPLGAPASPKPEIRGFKHEIPNLKPEK